MRGWAVVALALLGCRAPGEAAPGEPLGSAARASPNASLLPAPLSSPAASATGSAPLPSPFGSAARGVDTPLRALMDDAGAPLGPKVWLASRPSPADPLASLREAGAASRELPLREQVGLELRARLQWPGVPGEAPAELGRERWRALTQKSALELDIKSLPLGRLKLLLRSDGFPWPAGVELRARHELYGHALLWPDAKRFRVLEPGTLRALLLEGRADVGPLSSGVAEPQPDGHRLGLTTRRVALETALGRLTLELARVAGSGLGPESLCRLLLELAGLGPSSSVCEYEWVPLYAEYTWAEGGQLVFSVSELTRRSDLSIGAFAAPPADAAQTMDELPPHPPRALLSAAELGLLRARAARADEPAAPGSPKAGLLVVNDGELARYVALDGLPIAWLPPFSELTLSELRPGRYVAGWRDFLGGESPPAAPVDVPARATWSAGRDGGP